MLAVAVSVAAISVAPDKPAPTLWIEGELDCSQCGSAGPDRPSLVRSVLGFRLGRASRPSRYVSLTLERPRRARNLYARRDISDTMLLY